MTIIKQIMKQRIQPASPSDPVSVIAQILMASRMSVVPVCEGDKFKGIITERDIISKVVAHGLDPNEVKAEMLMANNIPKLETRTDIVEAARVMANAGVHYLPVLNRTGKFVGLVTLDDLVSESLALAGMVLSKTSKG